MASFFNQYGLRWPVTIHPLNMELTCIRYGGRWKENGKMVGNGMFYHFKKAQEILWPEKIWHRWNIKQLECYVENRFIGEMGAAAAGKTDSAASNVLLDWYAVPECTTVLVSSTDLRSLDLRIWGMIKRYHKAAREKIPWIPGHLIEGYRVIVRDARAEFLEGRDFKNGVIAVPTKKGNQYQGLGPLVGIHNKRVRMIADELNLMPRAFIDAVSNLAKCEDFKMVGLGNPNEPTNAHGMLCEPAAELGGWDSGIDQSANTKTWKTRMPGGVCLQLPGSDSPNMDGPPDQAPLYPFLITREQMEMDAQIWGRDDWHFTMMNEARMPRGVGSHRVITRPMCEKFHALDPPEWRDTNRIKIAFLDAAYLGGDRCVFGELQFGLQSEPLNPMKIVTNLSSQEPYDQGGKTILALIDTVVVPVSGDKGADLPEDQIVTFVKDQCERRGIAPENFYFESGMRTALVSAFARVWSPNTNPVDAGGKATERMVSGGIQVKCVDYYSKFITEMWYSIRLIVEAGQLRGLTEEVMLEGCQREWKNVAGNRIELETKTEMKLKTGRSPDLFDAFAVGVEGARQKGFVIGRIDNLTSRPTDAWKRQLRERAQKLWTGRELNYAA